VLHPASPAVSPGARPNLPLPELYHRVERHVPAIEWPVLAADIAPILALKRERNAVILAHNYQTPDIFHTVADIVGNIDGKKVAGFDKTIHGLEVDVVGIEEVGLRPAKFLDGRIGSGPRGAGLGADDHVVGRVRQIHGGRSGEVEQGRPRRAYQGRIKSIQ